MSETTAPYTVEGASLLKNDKDYEVIKHLSAAGLIPPTCFVDVCLDFDGVLNQYDSGWQGADVITDEPVEGALEALYGWLNDGLSLAIYSARSGQIGGIPAMRKWLSKHDGEYRHEHWTQEDVAKVPMLVERIELPVFKPAAQLYIDDRGYRFKGVFPNTKELKELFTPWYEKDV